MYVRIGIMPSREKAKLIDGFVTLRATQRHGLERRYASKPVAEEPPEEPTTKSAGDAQKKASPSGIGRTVMPTRYEIVCYSCGFQFVMRGKAESTQCPKCGARLGLNDETVTGVFTGELITAGKVVVKQGAILEAGKIVANDIVLEGSVKKTTIKAFKTLTLTKTATIPETAFEARNLHVTEGASFRFEQPRKFTDVEIAGKLEADIEAAGMVTLHPTGHLRGRLKTAHLIMEDGAGLNADVTLVPEEAKEEPARKTA